MQRTETGYQHENWRAHLGRGLAPRQAQAMLTVANGCTQKQGAAILGISKATFNSHISTSLYKLRAVNSSQAVGEAIRRGIITPLVLIMGLLINDGAITHDTDLRHNTRASMRVVRVRNRET